MTYVYPAIFTPYEEDGEKCFLVHYPDLNVNTEGEDLANALMMAKDVLEMMLADYEECGKEIPQSSQLPTPIVYSGYDKVPADNSFATMILADTDEWRKQNDQRAIRKNCSIPAWLNRKAELANAPFSQLLQKALMDYLQMNESKQDVISSR